MKHKSVIVILIMGLLMATAVLAACTITNDPAPQAPLAEVVTVERPSATATPTPSNTPPETMTLIETAVPTSTSLPTSAPTPIATATPFLAVSQPFLSSQRQLAFIKNQTIFVETTVSSGIFREVGDNVASMLWSPQGEKLIFETCDLSNRTYCIEPIWMLYDVKTNTLTSLNEQIPNIPRRHFGIPTWAKSGNTILFRMILEGDIFLLDLAEEEFVVVLDSLRLPLNMWELPNEKLLIQDNWGSGSNELHVYDFSGTKLWSYPNIRSWGIEGGNPGILGFSEEGQLLIMLEPPDNSPPTQFATLYHFNTASFDIERLASYQTLPGASTNISPDGQFVAISVPTEQDNYEDSALLIVDQNGRTYGQRPNSIIMDWRPSGGPVVKESIEGEQTQLVYWPLDGSTVQVFVSQNSFVFGEGKWSGDGRFFIYSAVDKIENQSYLYLWQPESCQPTLLQTAAGTDGFRNFTWLPDSTGVYFNLGHLELWKFEVATESLTLIANSTEN